MSQVLLMHQNRKNAQSGILRKFWSIYFDSPVNQRQNLVNQLVVIMNGRHSRVMR